MTQNYIIVFTIVEVFLSFVIIYLLIRADIIINTLQQEINTLHLHLPVLIRDIRTDVKNINAELVKHVSNKIISPQKIGYITGKIFTEILLLKMTALQVNKKFMIISIISKLVNMRKLCL